MSIRDIVIDITEKEKESKFIGYVGEHLCSTIQYIIPSEYDSEEHKYLLSFKLPNQDTQFAKIDSYPVKFDIPQALTLEPGTLQIQLTIYKGDVIAKSHVSNFFLLDSLLPVKEVENKYVGLLDNSIKIFNHLMDSASNGYIYFKKNCPDWSEPRIYFFNTDGISDGYNEAWEWQYSPYMTPNEEGYYYFPIVRGFDNVIFFCDETDASGFNYKTDNLLIPTSSWCNTPLFYQSDIGANGFWADYMTKTAKLIVQHNVHSTSINASGGTKLTDVKGISNSNSINLSVRDMGLISNSLIGIKNHYEYFEFLIDCEELHFTFNEKNPSGDLVFSQECQVKVQEVCYIYPVVYLDNFLFCEDFSVRGNIGYFNATLDKQLFSRVLLEQEIKNNINKLNSRITSLGNVATIETGFIPNSTIKASYSDVMLELFNMSYYVLGKLVILQGKYNIYNTTVETLKQQTSTLFGETVNRAMFYVNNILPFPSRSISYGILDSLDGVLNSTIFDSIIMSTYEAGDSLDICCTTNKDYTSGYSFSSGTSGYETGSSFTMIYMTM